MKPKKELSMCGNVTLQKKVMDYLVTEMQQGFDGPVNLENAEFSKPIIIDSESSLNQRTALFPPPPALPVRPESVSVS